MRCKYYDGKTKKMCGRKATLRVIAEPEQTYCKAHERDAWWRAGSKAGVTSLQPTRLVLHRVEREDDDGFIRPAIVIHRKDREYTGSFDLVDEEGNLICMINAFDFGNGVYDVDVIVNTEVDERFGDKNTHSSEILYWPHKGAATQRVEAIGNVAAVQITNHALAGKESVHA